MKKNLLFLLLLLCSQLKAQNYINDLESIAEAELKSGSALLAFEANPNTANYDVTYQKLEFTIDPNVYFISGNVTTHFTALENMSTITFDLGRITNTNNQYYANRITVGSVMMNSQSLAFNHNATTKELIITLPSTMNAGSTGIVSVSYAGAPDTAEQGFTKSSHSGVPIIWTLSEPFGARDWWPCKQDLTDKIDSVDIFLTAPSQYVSVANGVQMSLTDNGNGTSTTHFHHSYPIPAYLVAIAITNYSIFTQQAGTAPNEFPIVNYIYPESLSSAQNSLAVTLPIMDLFEDLFETYPFSNEKYGHAQFGWGGGMEHTTVSFMGSFGRNLIAHELAHQWFGDKITCGTWKDIWLNEGFATYLSGLVVEGLDGDTSFVSWKSSMIDNITSQNGGAVYLTDSEALNVSRIFSSRLSYNKGAMVIHMLRWKLGDAVFYQAIKNYLADPLLAYGYAVTEDLKFHLETTSGVDLTELFNDWVFNQGYPTYTATVSNQANNQALITLNQTQSHNSVDFFEMPVQVRLKGAGNQSAFVTLEHVNNGQSFLVDVPFTVTGMDVDPNKHIISKNNTATLGINTLNFNDLIVISPNPAHDFVTVQLPETLTLEKAELFSQTGQLIYSGAQKEMNVSNLATGIYFIKVETNEGSFHKKFIKN